MKDPEEAEGRSRRRAAERRKRRFELLENAIKDKMLKFDALGEIIEEVPFSEEEGLDENLEKDWATDAERAKSEIKDESEHRSIVSKQRWTLDSDFKVKIQTRAATQRDEFEYLFKETVVQPSSEESAVLHWFPWFWCTVLLARLLIKRAKHWFYFKTFLGF